MLKEKEHSDLWVHEAELKTHQERFSCRRLGNHIYISIYFNIFHVYETGKSVVVGVFL